METIDCTPTWSGLLPALLVVLTDGKTPEGQATVRKELKNMARVADEFVTLSKRMPNGFDSWHETHFNVVTYLSETSSNSGSMSENTMSLEGTGGLYDLAETLTIEFETLHKGREWDGEFMDEIDSFLDKKEREFKPQKAMTGRREVDEVN